MTVLENICPYKSLVATSAASPPVIIADLRSWSSASCTVLLKEPHIIFF